jgi:hypothetical protein
MRREKTSKMFVRSRAGASLAEARSNTHARTPGASGPADRSALKKAATA